VYSSNSQCDRQRGFFALTKTFFRRKTGVFQGKMALTEREKARCPGALGVGRIHPWRRDDSARSWLPLFRDKYIATGGAAEAFFAALCLLKQ